MDSIYEWRRSAASGPLPQGRSGHACCPVGSRIVVLCGGGDSVYFRDIKIFSTDHSKWLSPEVKGEEPGGRAYHSGAVVGGDRIFVFGGWKGDQFLNDLYLLESETHDWGRVAWSKPKTTGISPDPRAYHTASIYKNKMIIFGGWFMDFCNDLTVLNTETMEWSVQPVSGAPPPARAAHSATCVGGRLFVFGGESEKGRLNDVHVLDLETSTWSCPETRGTPPTPRSGHTAIAVGRWLAVFAGWDGDKHLQGMHLLDTETYEWATPKPATADALTPSVRSGHSCALVRGLLYVIGGWDRSCFLNDVWVLHGWGEAGGGGGREGGGGSRGRAQASVGALEGESGGGGGEGAGDEWVSRVLAELERGGLALLDGGTASPSSEWEGHLANGVGGGGGGGGDVAVALAKAMVASAARRVGPPPSDGAPARWTSEAESMDTAATSSYGGRGAEGGGKGGGRAGSPPGLNPRAATWQPRGEAAALQAHALQEVAPGSRLPGLRPFPRPRPRPTSAGPGSGGGAGAAGGSGAGAGEGEGDPSLAPGGAGADLVDVATAGMSMRSVLGHAARLHALLDREVGELRRHRGSLNALASAVDVQPLFATYGDLVRSEEAIRSAALAGDVGAAQAEVERRDALHATCRATAAELQANLERVTGKQRERADHLGKAVRDLRDAAGMLGRMEAAGGAGAGRGGDGGSAPRAGSPFEDLPEFFFEGDALAALEGPMGGFREWASQCYHPVREAVEETNRALAALRDAAAREAEAIAALGGDGEAAQVHGGGFSMEEGADRARALLSAASDFVGHLAGESRESELEHTQSLLADCASLAAKLAAADGQRAEIGSLRAELSSGARELLAAREKVIKMNAELELTRLRHPIGSQEVSAAEAEAQAQEALVGRLAARHEEIGDRLSELARRGHPELLCEPEGDIPGRLRHTGLVVARKLTNYEQVKLLKEGSRHVFLVRYQRRLCVLKEIALTDEASRKVFENEVTLLWKLGHPAIITVEAVFYDGLRAYIQMPYVEGGTMRQWLAASPKPWEVQSVFRQLLQGLAYLHDHGVVHRDMKLDNVLMTAEGRPVICDLGISKDHSTLLELSNTSTTTRGDAGDAGGDGAHGVQGTDGYIAPEVLAGHGATPASDMWAVGVMLYRAHFEGSPEPASPSPDGRAGGAGGSATPPLVAVPPHENEELRALLRGLLDGDPSMRTSANEALSSSYLATSVVRQLYDNKQILESDSKLEMLREQVRSLQEGRTAVSMRVRRAQLVGDVISIFREMHHDTLLYPLKVRFIGESGVDAGGLTSDLYTEFFNRLLEPDLAYFEAPPEEDTPLSGPAFLPAAGCRDLETFRMVGRVLVKSVIDRRPIPARLAPSFFKYLLGHEPNLRDLELYDRTLAVHLREILIKPVEGMAIFSETERGEDGEPAPVTDASKMAYVQERIHHVLVGAREPQLAAIRDGFLSVDLSSYMQMLSCTDLMLLVRGEEHIDAHMVIDLLAFQPPSWPQESQTPGDLVELLKELRPNDLRRFLRLATSQCTIPRTGSGGGAESKAAAAITVHRCPPSDRLPIGRTCFRRVDLPDYRSSDALREKVLLALANIDGSGFMVT